VGVGGGGGGGGGGGRGRRVQITGARYQNMLHMFWYCKFLRMPLFLILVFKYISLFF